MKPSIAAFLVALIAFVAIPVLASGTQPQPNWNGTWVGNWANGNGAQIIFAGNDLVGIYWRGDYLSDTQSAISPVGVVTITWPSGSATLTRDGETTAHIVIRETGKPDLSFALKRDA